jgi:hypothetical protein
VFARWYRRYRHRKFAELLAIENQRRALKLGTDLDVEVALGGERRQRRQLVDWAVMNGPWFGARLRSGLGFGFDLFDGRQRSEVLLFLRESRLPQDRCDDQKPHCAHEHSRNCTLLSVLTHIP